MILVSFQIVKLKFLFFTNQIIFFQLSLPDHLFLNKLSHLYLSHNQFSSLDDIHSNLLAQVQHLDLNENKIREVLSRLARNEKISFSKQNLYLNQIFISFRHFYKNNLLKVLILSRNNVTTIDNCVFCNTSLQTLNLAHNKMAHINELMVHWVNYSSELK